MIADWRLIPGPVTTPGGGLTGGWGWGPGRHERNKEKLRRPRAYGKTALVMDEGRGEDANPNQRRGTHDRGR